MNNVILVWEADGSSLIMEHPENVGVFDVKDVLGDIEIAGLTYRIEEYVADMMMLGYDVRPGALEEYQQAGISHVALLADQGGSRRKGYWFGTEKYKNGGIMCLYSESRNEYRYLHCEHCATALATWAVQMQSEWGIDESLGLQKAGPTRH